MHALLDRLARVPTWRLVLFVVHPIAFTVVWVIGSLRAGHVAWAVVFSLILAVAVAVWIAAVVLKLRNRSGEQPSSN